MTIGASTDNLFDNAGNQLFRNILANGEHILHHYMPQRTTLSHCRHYLRPPKHNRELTHSQDPHAQ